eukprot:COSAG04_NODE_6620_length_1291_cov_1.478188_2_plen_110_part_00
MWRQVAAVADGVRRDFGWSEALRQLVAQAAFDTLLERFGRCVSLAWEFSAAGWMALYCWDFRLACSAGDSMLCKLESFAAFCCWGFSSFLLCFSSLCVLFSADTFFPTA